MGRRPCVLAANPVSLHESRVPPILRVCAHAIVALFLAYPEGDAEGGRNRLASADAARRHDAAGGRPHPPPAAPPPAGGAEKRGQPPPGAEPPPPPPTLFFP